MSNNAPIDVGQRVNAALDYAESVDDVEVRAHYLWEIEQLTSVVNLTDLTTSELISLTALLIPAHARFLARRGRPDAPTPTKKGLHVIR